MIIVFRISLGIDCSSRQADTHSCRLVSNWLDNDGAAQLYETCDGLFIDFIMPNYLPICIADKYINTYNQSALSKSCD